MLSLPSAYLAPVSWYLALAAAGSAEIDACEHYVKQTWRNRCRIAMPTGPQDLVIPVQATQGHVAMRDVRISDHGNWRHHHWSALRTAYGKSPFFEYYADDFASFYHERRYDFLLDFNQALHEVVCREIDLSVTIKRSSSFLNAQFPVHSSRPYYQVFAQQLGFLPDLSIADLLFNMGPEALLVLTEEK
ncbi:MAG: WbqC family protein [Bacteroidaceae bacterium]|nr:WbqC family protein [Bacteroidaceae bacterium]